MKCLVVWLVWKKKIKAYQPVKFAVSKYQSQNALDEIVMEVVLWSGVCAFYSKTERKMLSLRRLEKAAI